MWYLDDGLIFAQSVTALNEALLTICRMAGRVGLEVNLAKCALVVPPSMESMFTNNLHSPLSAVPPSATVVVLGAPIAQTRLRQHTSHTS